MRYVRIAAAAALGLGLALAPARAERPAAPDPPAEAVLADLPFLPSDELNRIVVDLAADGAPPFPLLLDTGSTHSVVTPGMARTLGVRVSRTKRTPYRRPTSLGRDLQFHVDTRASDTASRTGWEYGLLGGEFLAQYVIELDFQARRVRFLDRDHYRVPETATAPDEVVLPLQVTANRPHVEVSIGAGKVTALLDSGDPFTVFLTERAARDAPWSEVPLRGLEVSGVLGPLRTRVGELAGLGLGGATLARVPLLVARSHYNQGGASGAVLGYGTLEHFRVRIDYPRRRLWLERRPDVPVAMLGVPWAEVRSTGAFAVQREGELLVLYVIEDSPAWQSGLRPGDVVEAGALGAGPSDARRLADHLATQGTLAVLRPTDAGYERVELGRGAPAPPAAP